MFMISWFQKSCQKLANRNYGYAYKLNLLERSHIHPTIYVLLLKKYLGDHKVISYVLPPITDDGEIVTEPKAIIDSQWIKHGRYIK